MQFPPLFRDDADYRAFKERHDRDCVESADPTSYVGKAYLGVDSGSTTIKMCIISEDGKLLVSRYSPNNGNPIQAVESFLLSFYEDFPYISLAGAASTGYGEELMKSAFRLDYSLVETQAHFLGARFFMPDVDFIIDIGGQDMKCFKIRDGNIDDIFLNEACSSGCGSFLQTFALALGKSVGEFASAAIRSQHPVDLGSRCTVFMNSSVKQAQKDGALLEDISAGLAISVVKNAIYKVIRATSAESLGRHIVVQGGTFLNDAVLRAFEQEIKADVIRPNIAGLMGAFGAALYARRRSQAAGLEKSTILTEGEIREFTHEVRSTKCQGCTNHCLLTINIFPGGRRLISGNRCERPVTKTKVPDPELTDIYAYKGIRLRLAEEGQLHADMSPTLATALVTNLLKNTYIHNIPGGEIDIRITPRSLTFRNTGIPEALDSDRVFHRFYQGKTPGQNSSGLGLSISQAISHLYHIRIAYRYDGMHCFELLWEKTEK